MSQIAVNVRKATAADAYTPMNIGAYQRSRHVTEPPRALWVAIATDEAAEAGLDPEDVMGHYKGHKVCRARWRAFKRILDMPEGYSLRGLSRICGWSPTDVRYGVQKVGGPFISAIWNGPARKRNPFAPSGL